MTDSHTAERGPGGDCDALPPGEEQYRMLFELSPLPMWMIDRGNLAFLAVNDAAVRHYGYSRQEFLTLTARAIRPAEDVPRFLELFRAEEGRNVSAPVTLTGWRHRKKDGTVIDVEVTTYPVVFLGRPAYFVQSLDVTQRRRAEEQLRISEELNRRILEAVPAGIVHVMPDGSIPRANAEAERILGLSWDELSRRYVRDFDPETIWEDGTACRAEDYPVSKCLQTGQPQPAATIGVRRPCGDVSWAVYTAVPLLDGSTHRAAGAVVTFLDITERKRAEEALRLSDERLRLLVTQMPAVLWALDTELRFTLSVGAGLVGLKLRPNQVVGMSLYEFFGTNDPEFSHIASHRRALAGASVNYELTLEGRTFQAHLEPVIRDGAVVGCIGVALDITPRKQDEEKLKDYAAHLQVLSRRLLDVQEQERRHLARELHDEIGQLLTGLKLTLEMGARQREPDRDATLGAARAMTKDLTERVRDLSLRLRPTMLDDLGLVPALLWLFERFAAQTQVGVAFEHRGLERRFAPAAETAAYRIVQEALTNVARHARINTATVRGWLDAGVLSVQVEDRGAGFDPLTVTHARSSSGLSGMRERAELLGGALDVAARPGAGTCVTATLPVEHNEEEHHGVDARAGG